MGAVMIVPSVRFDISENPKSMRKIAARVIGSKVLPLSQKALQ